jgi:hypothetical protein
MPAVVCVEKTWHNPELKFCGTRFCIWALMSMSSLPASVFIRKLGIIHPDVKG